ncbi:MAG: SPOR domain-containing protein [Methyloprofundus sp.]|nr:SPOR domain-containing protein [Methyloprofundus sp.]
MFLQVMSDVGDMGKKQHNKREETALELDKLDENNALLAAIEKVPVVAKANSSLDDLLSFDTQVFVSNTAQVAHLNKTEESVERSENKQADSNTETSIETAAPSEAISESLEGVANKVDKAVVTGLKRPAELVDALSASGGAGSSEPVVDAIGDAICEVVATSRAVEKPADVNSDPRASEAVPDSMDMGAVSPFVWDNRILQLEHELGKSKKMLRALARVYRQLERTNYKYKIISIISLFVAVNALLISIWFGALVVDRLVEPEEVKRVVVAVDKYRVSPVGRLENDRQISSQVLGADLNKPIKIGPLLEERFNAVGGVLMSAELRKVAVAGNEMLEVKVTDKFVMLKPALEIPAKQWESTEIKAATDVLKPKASTRPRVKKWAVNLYSSVQRQDAQKRLKELSEKGIQAELLTISESGETWFRLRVPGFATEADAESYAAKAEKVLGDRIVWVSKS